MVSIVFFIVVEPGGVESIVFYKAVDVGVPGVHKPLHCQGS